jgi:hypothetical protein
MMNWEGKKCERCEKDATFYISCDILDYLACSAHKPTVIKEFNDSVGDGQIRIEYDRLM